MTPDEYKRRADELLSGRGNGKRTPIDVDENLWERLKSIRDGQCMVCGEHHVENLTCPHMRAMSRG